jgi:osmoprotectant transport system permease protein
VDLRAWAQLVHWLREPARWTGSDSIPARVLEHLHLSLTATLLAVLVALPLGVYLGHAGGGGGPGRPRERVALAVINVVNAGRALPSMALLAFALPVAFRFGLGLGFWPAVLMLVPLGVPLVLLNTYTALRAVDRELVEVARGLGMGGGRVLRAVELPVAAPVIVAGVRNAAVTIVATATLGALAASGGLGRFIVDGLARREDPRLLTGALLVALLSLLTEAAFGVAERLLLPRGLRTAARPPGAPSPADSRPGHSRESATAIPLTARRSAR